MTPPEHWPERLLFSCGRVIEQAGAIAVALSAQPPAAAADYIIRHCAGDHGEAYGQTLEDNRVAIERGSGLVVSAYRVGSGLLIVQSLLSPNAEPVTHLVGLDGFERGRLS